MREAEAAAASFLLVAFALSSYRHRISHRPDWATKFRFALVGCVQAWLCPATAPSPFRGGRLGTAVLVVVWHRSRPGGRSALVRGAKSRSWALRAVVLFLSRTFRGSCTLATSERAVTSSSRCTSLAIHARGADPLSMSCTRRAATSRSATGFTRWERNRASAVRRRYRSAATDSGKVQLLHTNEAYRIGGALLWAIPWVVLWCFARRRRASGEATRIGVQFLPMLGGSGRPPRCGLGLGDVPSRSDRTRMLVHSRWWWSPW